ncbi:MAG: electron transfer flavoprotein subunit alpha/FixB family protein [Candidatus Aminicenantes bacterium]|nr:electron transfer flavoprotein subunit alpha/FixB family protein [Candidatus Aminicenantes bacterium]
MWLVFIEKREGKIKKSSLETLAETSRRAEELDLEVAAVVVGSSFENLTPLWVQGAKKTYWLKGEDLEVYSPEIYAQVLYELIQQIKPEAVFFAGTALGRDLAPRLAAKLRVALVSDCTRIIISNGSLLFVRPVYAGKALLTLKLKTKPFLATLRPNVFPLKEIKDENIAPGEIIEKTIGLNYNGPVAKVVEIVREEGAELDVTEAEVIISGGRGMKAAENFNLLRELSTLIPRSAIGASRAAVDSGWIGHQHQVGQTGKTVCPNLYLAFGISGSIQHLAGMSGSKVIVAVNKDPEAPIFKVADLGVVGDLFQIIPPLKEELRKALAE